MYLLSLANNGHREESKASRYARVIAQYKFNERVEPKISTRERVDNGNDKDKGKNDDNFSIRCFTQKCLCHFWASQV